MVAALFDTNILIDHLNAVLQARDEIARYPDRAISVITWMEVMIGAEVEVADATQRYLDGFVLVPLHDRIAERAVALRREHRVKLPDAVIWATAQVEGRLLITRDIKGLPDGDPHVRAPYRL